MLNPRTRDMMAWNGAAVFLGGALPMLLMGRAVMAVWLVLGIVFGLFAVGRKLWQGSLWRSAVMTRGVALSAAMLGALFLSAVFSIDVGYSMGRFGELLGLALGALLLFVVLREMPGRSLHLSIKVMAICTVGAILLVLADAFSDSQRLSAALHGRKWDQVHRLNYMSSVLAVLLPYLWVWLLKRARDQEPLALLFALPISLVGFFAVFVCGGRAGWAAVFVAAVLLLWLGGRWHGVVLHTRHWVALPVFLALGPIGYGLSRGWDVMLERILVWREQMGAMSGRGDIWAHAWNHVGDNWLTGIGINAFRKLPVPFEPFPSNAHPHNFVNLMKNTILRIHQPWPTQFGVNKTRGANPPQPAQKLRVVGIGTQGQQLAEGGVRAQKVVGEFTRDVKHGERVEGENYVFEQLGNRCR